MGVTEGSAPDPYVVAEIDPLRIGFNAIDGRIEVDPRLVSTQKTAVIISAGESTIANYDAPNALFTPGNATVHNLDIYSGGIYQATDPLLSNQNGKGCLMGRLGDKLINVGTFARVILVPLAVGGT